MNWQGPMSEALSIRVAALGPFRASTRIAADVDGVEVIVWTVRPWLGTRTGYREFLPGMPPMHALIAACDRAAAGLAAELPWCAEHDDCRQNAALARACWESRR